MPPERSRKGVLRSIGEKAVFLGALALGTGVGEGSADARHRKAPNVEKKKEVVTKPEVRRALNPAEIETMRKLGDVVYLNLKSYQQFRDKDFEGAVGQLKLDVIDSSGREPMQAETQEGITKIETERYRRMLIGNNESGRRSDMEKFRNDALVNFVEFERLLARASPEMQEAYQTLAADVRRDLGMGDKDVGEELKNMRLKTYGGAVLNNSLK